MGGDLIPIRYAYAGNIVALYLSIMYDDISNNIGHNYLENDEITRDLNNINNKREESHFMRDNVHINCNNSVEKKYERNK